MPKNEPLTLTKDSIKNDSKLEEVLNDIKQDLTKFLKEKVKAAIIPTPQK